MIPIYQIIVDGQDLTNTINRGEKSLLENLSISDKIGLTSDTFNFTLVYDGSFRIPPTKGKCEVSIGYESVVPRNPQIQYGLWKVGDFIVESVNFSSSRSGKTLQVTATSMPQSPNSALDSLQNSHTRYWQSYAVKGTTFEFIVNEVCNRVRIKGRYT